MIKRVLREFFLISRSEQRGLLIAAIILFLTLIFRFIMGLLPSNPVAEDYDFINEAYELLAITENCEEQGKALFPFEGKESVMGVLHPAGFNPNEISENELLEMNIPRFAASNIVKYRKAGGYFHKPDDLLKIYGIDTAIFSLLKPYIIIPGENIDYQEINRNEVRPGYEEQGKNYGKNWYRDERGDQEKTGFDRRVVKDSAATHFRIELNTADSAALVSLPGIGPVYAARIIKYRSLLGGFTELSQLNEVYGLESFMYNNVDSLVSINIERVTALNLNTAGYGELLRHPYLTKNDVAAILAYREFAGKINSVDEVNQSLGLDSAGWRRIRVYLDITENDTTSKNLLH